MVLGIKCLYNTSDYANRIASGEFVKLHEESSNWRPTGERSSQAYYGLETDRLVKVRLQWFELKDGTITRSGLKDPKWMHCDGASYHLHGGDGFWRDFRRDPTGIMCESTNQWLIWAKKCYGDWRRLKCVTFGPVEAWWRRRWFATRLYAVWRGIVDRCAVMWKRSRKALKPFRSTIRRLFSGLQGPALVLA